MNSLAKVYDYVLLLCNRLSMWFKLSREQAGAEQRSRLLLEHIVSLRLLIDYCMFEGNFNYILYILCGLFQSLQSTALMRILKRLGCGAVMLAAIMSMYRVSYSILGANTQ